MTTTFDDFALLPELRAAVGDMGYDRPTPIQAESIPVALAGRDLIGCASTGTGKTAAFVLPLLQRLASGDRGRCRALVLAPTRELALQIDEQVLALGYHVGLTAVAVVGGMDMGDQEHAIRAGVEIVVATPGRLLDHMRFGYVDLTGISVLVLDEADRMLDMGFLPDLRRILAALPAERQTMMFSATMAPDVLDLAHAILRDPVKIAVGAQKPAAGIVQSVYPVAEERKAELLTTLLRHEAMRSVLVFVKRKVDASRLSRAVQRSGISATSISADRSQEERIAALESFRRGETPVLIATDVASRGLDVEGISHVINFHVPFSADAYIHRGGRTARAGAVGEVLTFVSPEEERDLVTIEREIGTVLPRRFLPAFDHGVHEHVPPGVGEARSDRGAGERRGRGRDRRRFGGPPPATAASPGPDAAGPGAETPAPAPPGDGDGAARRRRRRPRRRAPARSGDGPPAGGA